jgi:predicted nucleotidyltransferase
MSVEGVLSSASKVQVLRVLSDSSSAYSPQELEKETTKNISVIYDAVRELEQGGVIKSVNTEGKKNYYRLNDGSFFSKQVKQLFEAEKEEYGLELPAHLVNVILDAENRLKNKVEGLEIILLFGSMARGDFTPESDIDLYLVVEEKSVEVEDDIYDVLDRYDRDFSVVIRDVDSFESDFGDQKSDLAKSIMLEGFSILYSSGKELEKVIKQSLGLDYLAERGLAEEKEEIQKLRDVLAEFDYEVDKE